jgi:hypothetical protein
MNWRTCARNAAVRTAVGGKASPGSKNNMGWAWFRGGVAQARMAE